MRCLKVAQGSPLLLQVGIDPPRIVPLYVLLYVLPGTDRDATLHTVSRQTACSTLLRAQIGIDPPRGVLLYGPPGTGKTMLAKAVAHHTTAAFIRVVGSEFVQKYLGEGPRMVRDVFRLAKENSPAIIFIDEVRCAEIDAGFPVLCCVVTSGFEPCGPRSSSSTKCDALSFML
jgi:ATP-dependent 26S proteasome regulatory subunit